MLHADLAISVEVCGNTVGFFLKIYLMCMGTL